MKMYAVAFSVKTEEEVEEDSLGVVAPNINTALERSEVLLRETKKGVVEILGVEYRFDVDIVAA